MLANGWHVGHRRDHTIAEIIRVRAGVAQASNSIYRANGTKQICKIVRAVVVRIDRLAEQHDFRQTLGNDFTRLANDVRQLATALVAARERDDAIRTPIVAATLHGDPRFHPFKAARHDILVMLFEIEVRRRKLLPLSRCGDQLRQRTIPVRSNNQRHMLGLREQARSKPLRHATSHADDGASFHVAFEFTETPEHAGLCIFANRAGIDENHVRAIGAVHGLVAMRDQLAVHELRIGNVHLTAIRLDVDRWLQGHSRVFGDHA